MKSAGKGRIEIGQPNEDTRLNQGLVGCEIALNRQSIKDGEVLSQTESAQKSLLHRGSRSSRDTSSECDTVEG